MVPAGGRRPPRNRYQKGIPRRRVRVSFALKRCRYVATGVAPKLTDALGGPGRWQGERHYENEGRNPEIG